MIYIKKRKKEDKLAYESVIIKINKKFNLPETPYNVLYGVLSPVSQPFNSITFAECGV